MRPRSNPALHDPFADVSASDEPNVYYGTPGDDSPPPFSGYGRYHMEDGGNDTLRGQGDPDAYYFGATLDRGDQIDGGGGVDTVYVDGDYGNGLDWDGDRFKNIEQLFLDGQFDFKITLSSHSALPDMDFTVRPLSSASGHIDIDGHAVNHGSLALYGAGLSDQLTGGGEQDILYGLDGNDRLMGLGGADSAIGELGRDKLTGGSGDDTLIGQEDNDLLVGGSGGDFLTGGAGRDRLVGGGGDDFLFGGTGSDTLRGGAGRDFPI